MIHYQNYHSQIFFCLAIGETCETTLSQCDIFHPCHNNSTCIDLTNSYQCICMPRFTGVNCSLLITNCDLDPCNNGGTCTELDEGYNCECLQGFTGKDDIVLG